HYAGAEPPLNAALTEAVGGTAGVLFPRTAADIASLPDTPAILLLVIATDVPDLDRAMLLAAVGPLAVEIAPDRRIAAIDVGPGADPDDVVAASQFLTSAESSTGQVLRITAR
ncbi:hypothetical protein DBR17_19140, partial [Sphingomonas sp. HMWF008]